MPTYRVLFAALVAVSPTVLIARPHVSAHAAATIEPNENRRPAGALAKGVLTVHLEARTGDWQPDGTGGPTITTAAFGEVGKSLQTPGPLLRAPIGTEVHASIHNLLTKPMWVYGLGASRGLRDSAQVAPGATHEFTFRLSERGTYYYVARTDSFPVFGRVGEDSQLGGIIVVDGVNEKPAAGERIYAVTTWFSINPTTVSGLGPNGTMAFNGRTFLGNSRIEMTEGDSAHWRFVNISPFDHPLHLHGFYFAVNSKGDGARDTIFAAADRRTAVTEYMLPMQTMSLAWSPNRSGNWIFHCHFAGHMAPREAWEADRTSMTMPAGMVMQAGSPRGNDVMKHMSNLVLAIHVTARGKPPVLAAPTRNIRLLMRSKANVYGKYVGYSFVLGGSPEEKNTSVMKVPGPTLELIRGERVAITIVNQSHEPTAVHWHGIELESYPDGVPGVSGDGANILPHVMPGDSITVRFTPPRAGTFMYHSHSNEFQQISSGLYGALIVRERGEVADPNERVLMFSDNGPMVFLIDPTKFPAALLNGQLAPAPIDISAGKAARLRVINIRSDMAVQLDLVDGDKPAEWRIVAKDGMPTAAANAKSRPASMVLGAGEAYDLELSPRAASSLTLKYALPGLPPGLLPATSVQLRVR